MRSLLAGLALMMAAGPVWAKDIVGTWKTAENRPLTISYRDDDHMRMETGQDGYMLVRGDKVYAVNRKGGKWQAVDMDEMTGMMKMFGQGAVHAAAIREETVRFEPTGRSETIAGYKGNEYRVTYVDGSGQSHEQEVVLSDHPDVKELSDAWVGLASRMAQMIGKQTAEELERATRLVREKGYGGILRSGDDMILQSLERVSRKASYYELPSNVEMVHMGSMGMGSMGMGSMGAGSPSPAGSGANQGASAQEGSSPQGEAQDLASETGYELKEEAKQEAKDSAKRNLKKAIRGLW